MEDSDFEQTLENADPLARRVYREEAKQIEELRKGIIAVSANEEPYDIFICYKETDENGQRTLDSVLAQDIYDALSEKGYRTFYSGAAMGFDLLCALTVLNMKGSFMPEARLILALPCYNHYKNWSKNDKRVLANLLERADEVVYVSEDYRPGCMHKRNRYMVDRASFCIAYCTKKTGGTAYTVKYAQKSGMEIKNLVYT
jgi:uncharacterized phage-like protein YoqJ